jgi:exopolyphosphatase/guanosine-5'-triphosphate,3'-diphosphate pyrophosphatase
MTCKRLAGIDIGTLTCRLLIADLSADTGLNELCSERQILRLGEGVDQSKRLKHEAVDRVIHCLKDWRATIESYRVHAQVAVATSAVRDAANKQEFLNRVRSEAGFEVEILSGDEEARQTMLGIHSGLPGDITDVLALDIGGGSTEFVLALQGQSPVVRSIDIGVVRLSERLLHHDPPTRQEIAEARAWIQRETTVVLAAMPQRTGLRFVGTAGTITSLAAMALQLPAYDAARIHNYRLALNTITDLEEDLLSRRQSCPNRHAGLGKKPRRRDCSRSHHPPDGDGHSGRT